MAMPPSSVRVKKSTPLSSVPTVKAPSARARLSWWPMRGAAVFQSGAVVPFRCASRLADRYAVAMASPSFGRAAARGVRS
jgi:hypothetical protein